MALLRSVATVGGYTLLSRVLGFVRDILTAAFLGAGPVADAFFIAQRLPNMFRSLFAEGAFSAAFVPLFAGRIATEGRDSARLFAEDALAVLLAALLLFVLLGEAAMPWFIQIIAPGFAAEPGKYALTVELTRITFPYLLFISLVSLQGGVLNSIERFAATAATSILLNLFLITALALSRLWPQWTAHGQAWGIAAAGFAQFLWLMISCARAGMALRLPWPRLTAEVRRLIRIMLPGVFGAGVTQINLLVSTAIASLLPSGAVSYLYYADRLNQLPLGVVGIAVGTAILPSLSRQIRTDEAGAARHTQNRGIELALLLTLPAAVALAVAARPILAIFERGHFDAAAAAATAPALAAYAAGLPAFVLVKVLVPAFFARHDTATPVKIGILAMGANIALTAGAALLLAAPEAHIGVALATSAAGWVNALTMAAILRRRGHLALDARARRCLPRILLAALGMGAVLLVAERLLAPALEGGAVLRLGALVMLVGIGLAAYGVLALAAGAADWRDVRRRLRRQAA
ncbi:MAG TPA: murein biosynthesis integral membrane protein MurJ [Stellaceae bacterium]|nr:murein biosynthesis integral membrane protein MurJ [Stellaceae bacterium]